MLKLCSACGAESARAHLISLIRNLIVSLSHSHAVVGGGGGGGNTQSHTPNIQMLSQLPCTLKT